MDDKMKKMDEMAEGILKELFGLAEERMSMVAALEVRWDDTGMQVGVCSGQTPAREHFVEHFGERAYREIIEVFRDASYRISDVIQRSGKVKGVITIDADAARAQAAKEAEKP